MTTMPDITITEDQRKRLLHVYETLALTCHHLQTHDERAVVRASWHEIWSCLQLPPNSDLKAILHGGGEWADDEDIVARGHWKAVM